MEGAKPTQNRPASRGPVRGGVYRLQVMGHSAFPHREDPRAEGRNPAPPSPPPPWAAPGHGGDHTHIPGPPLLTSPPFPELWVATWSPGGLAGDPHLLSSAGYIQCPVIPPGGTALSRKGLTLIHSAFRASRFGSDLQKVSINGGGGAGRDDCDRGEWWQQ